MEAASLSYPRRKFHHSSYEAIAEAPIPAEEPTHPHRLRELRQGFGSMRESLRLAKVQLKSLGRLAMLDLQSVKAELEVESDSREAQKEVPETIGLGERIRYRADLIRAEQRHRRREIRMKVLGRSAVAGTGAAVGFAISQFLN